MFYVLKWPDAIFHFVQQTFTCLLDLFEMHFVVSNFCRYTNFFTSVELYQTFILFILFCMHINCPTVKHNIATHPLSVLPGHGLTVIWTWASLMSQQVTPWKCYTRCQNFDTVCHHIPIWLCELTKGEKYKTQMHVRIFDKQTQVYYLIGWKLWWWNNIGLLRTMQFGLREKKLKGGWISSQQRNLLYSDMCNPPSTATCLCFHQWCKTFFQPLTFVYMLLHDFPWLFPGQQDICVWVYECVADKVKGWLIEKKWLTAALK